MPIKFLRRNEWLTKTTTPRGRPTNKGTRYAKPTNTAQQAPPPCQSKTSNEMNGQPITAPRGRDPHKGKKTCPPDTRQFPKMTEFHVQEKNRKPHPSSRNRRRYHLIMYLSKLKYIKTDIGQLFKQYNGPQDRPISPFYVGEKQDRLLDYRAGSNRSSNFWFHGSPQGVPQIRIMSLIWPMFADHQVWKVVTLISQEYCQDLIVAIRCPGAERTLIAINFELVYFSGFR